MREVFLNKAQQISSAKFFSPKKGATLPLLPFGRTKLPDQDNINAPQEKLSSLNYYANFAVNTRVPRGIPQISFRGQTANTINKAIILAPLGDIPIIKRADGGYPVDAETNTVIYYGDEAKKFLQDTSHYMNETQIIAQSGCKIAIESAEGKALELSEPGAILINPDTLAKIKVREGNPMVITSENAPLWYSKMSPVGEHRDFFEILADKNRRIYSGQISKEALTDEYSALKKHGIIEENEQKDGNDYVKFAHFEEKKPLKQKLDETDLNEKQKAKIVNIWRQIQERKKAPHQNAGEVTALDFKDCPDWVYDKLCSHKILERDKKNVHNATWGDFYKLDELQGDLWKKAGIYGEVRDKVVKIWEKTTKSGYDLTGLAQVANGITIYLFKDKMNQHNSTSTEWVSSSIEWTKQGPLNLCVSNIHNNDLEAQPRDFKKIRKTEKIHCHNNPDNPEEKQVEVYLVTQGRAAFCTAKDNNNKIRIIDKGEMYVIPSDMPHAILAVDGEYEHLVTQIPSAFQYGFKLKNIKNPVDDKILEEAKTRLSQYKTLKTLSAS